MASGGRWGRAGEIVSTFDLKPKQLTFLKVPLGNEKMLNVMDPAPSLAQFHVAEGSVSPATSP